MAVPSIVTAQVPSSVRLLHPTCESAIPWSTLGEALRVELRTMGSELADSDGAPAHLVIDAPCGESSAWSATIVHVQSGRSASEHIELAGANARTVAVSLSELVRARWGELLVAPAPAAPSVDPMPIEREIASRVEDEVERRLGPAVDRAVQAAMPEPEPEHPPESPPSTFVDLAFGVAAYPGGDNAIAALRAGVSFLVLAPFRMAVEIAGGVGSVADALGDVLIGGLDGGLSLRLAHARREWMIEAGPRIDAGWAHAEGMPFVPGVFGLSLDAFHFALGLDLRFRARLFDSLWVLLSADVGASLAGIDARSEDRRVTAQLGPRIVLMVGVAYAP